jgi:RimJ/RimL family protein N-acetyltransferase
MKAIHLKTLSLRDTKMIFDWRNDPTIVGLSSSQKKVTWEEHEEWIKGSIHNAARQVYIIHTDSGAIGQVRFDRLIKPTDVAISVYLLGEYTGQGMGVKAIQEGTQSIFNLWSDIHEVYAFVRSDNYPSHKAFLKSGFTIQAGSIYDRDEHLTFTIKKILS